MTSPRRGNHFPDFFTTKGPIPLNVTPINFDNRIYYQASIVSQTSELDVDARPHLKPYLDNDDEIIDCADMEENYDISLTKSGKFQTSFYVPSSFHSFLIGAKGSKLKAFQRSTNTTIKIPRINERGDVVILGETERQVASARTQIAMTIAQRKDRMPPTHFISIPIDSTIIRQNLEKFHHAVLQNPSKGVTDSLFQKAVKVHLTVAVLILFDDEEIENAKKCLQACYEEHITAIFAKNKKYKVRVQGLEIMNDDPSNVYVLYAKVQMADPELNGKLQKMCDGILSYFLRAGLAKKEADRVKLHMTVMNASFRKGNGRSMPFDARELLEEHGNFYFGEFELKQLDLCIRGTTTNELGEPKYYDTALNIIL
uniref:K Homology domain-containing protein n=1 Tax=Dendroctonus ponderosae TaxID=77166 RepID=J3JZE2_DENPD|nr:unknown [Dendroctonus ponderosae]